MPFAGVRKRSQAFAQRQVFALYYNVLESQTRSRAVASGRLKPGNLLRQRCDGRNRKRTGKHERIGQDAAHGNADRAEDRKPQARGSPVSRARRPRPRSRRARRADRREDVGSELPRQRRRQGEAPVARPRRRRQPGAGARACAPVDVGGPARRRPPRRGRGGARSQGARDHGRAVDRALRSPQGRGTPENLEGDRAPAQARAGADHRAQGLGASPERPPRVVRRRGGRRP